MQAWDEHFWRFTASGVLVNINDLLRDLKKADVDDFIKGQWNGFQIPNTNFRFGIPTYINVGVLYYNKNTFQRNGVKEPDATWTYDTYAETAKRLTRTESGPAGLRRLPPPERQPDAQHPLGVRRADRRPEGLQEDHRPPA